MSVLHPYFSKLVSLMPFPSIESSFPGPYCFLWNGKKGSTELILRGLCPLWLNYMVVFMVMVTCSWNGTHLSELGDRNGDNSTVHLLF